MSSISNLFNVIYDKFCDISALFSDTSNIKSGILFVLISFISNVFFDTSNIKLGILFILISFIADVFWLISNIKVGILLLLISFISCSIVTILLLDKSLILVRLLDISNLFCDISVLCSSVVCKYVVFKVVTVYFKSLTSWNKSEFTIVAEPYRPAELILIIIL